MRSARLTGTLSMLGTSTLMECAWTGTLRTTRIRTWGFAPPGSFWILGVWRLGSFCLLGPLSATNF